MIGSVVTGKGNDWMARLPDGWIFIPKFKDMTTITVEQRELVCCKNCMHGCDWDDGKWKCIINGGMHAPDWFCADGERAVKWHE